MDPHNYVIVQMGDQDPAESQTSTSQTFVTANYYYDNTVTATKLENSTSARKRRCCHLCNHFALTEQDLARHVETAHEEQIKMMNAKRHTRDADVECKYCGLILNSEASYRDHAKKDHFEQVSKEWQLCTICQNYFESLADLILHKNIGHLQPKDNPDHECSVCGKSFNSDVEYHKHANLLHKDEICLSWQHPCDRCSMFFPSSIHLSRHKVQNHFHQIVGKKKPAANTRSPYFYPQPQISVTKPTVVSKQISRPKIVRKSSTTTTNQTSKRVEPMMVRVRNNVDHSGVIFFKQEDSAGTSSPENQSRTSEGCSNLKKVRLTYEESTPTRESISVYVDRDPLSNDASSATYILPDAVEQGNRVSGIQMQPDCITFQVQEQD